MGTVYLNSPFATDTRRVLGLFSGRKQELQLLRRLLADGGRAAVISGPAGVGKTMLSWVYGIQNSDAYPGGVHTKNASWFESGAHLLSSAIPKSVNAPTLLILDEADALDDQYLAEILSGLQVQPLLHLVLITRRSEDPSREHISVFHSQGE